jgi:hypothetical protein
MHQAREPLQWHRQFASVRQFDRELAIRDYHSFRKRKRLLSADRATMGWGSRFNNGAEGEVDLAAELDGEVFEPLRDKMLFAQIRVHPDLRTIAWPNGADMAPEVLLSLVRVRA